MLCASRPYCARKRWKIASKVAPGPHWSGEVVSPSSNGLTMIAELKEKLSGEVAKLRYELNVTLPQEIRKAVEHGDLRENSEYKAALERQRFVQARLGQLMQRLSKLSDIDVTQIPTDRVGLGSRVIVEDPVTELRETYELVFGDGGELQDGQVSMSSPIGLALQNKSVGESAVLKLPTRTRRLKIVELLTIHQLDMS